MQHGCILNIAASSRRLQQELIDAFSTHPHLRLRLAGCVVCGEKCAYIQTQHELRRTARVRPVTGSQYSDPVLRCRVSVSRGIAQLRLVIIPSVTIHKIHNSASPPREPQRKSPGSTVHNPAPPKESQPASRASPPLYRPRVTPGQPVSTIVHTTTYSILPQHSTSTVNQREFPRRGRARGRHVADVRRPPPALAQATT